MKISKLINYSTNMFWCCQRTMVQNTSEPLVLYKWLLSNFWEPQWLQCIFLTNFVVFWTKSWGILGNSFSLVLIQLFLLFLENFANFLISQNWRGGQKKKKSPPWLYTKFGLWFYFYFFQKQGLNLRTAPIIQGSIPLCNNRPTLIITKVDVLITN